MVREAKNGFYRPMIEAATRQTVMVNRLKVQAEQAAKPRALLEQAHRAGIRRQL